MLEVEAAFYSMDEIKGMHKRLDGNIDRLLQAIAPAVARLKKINVADQKQKFTDLESLRKAARLLLDIRGLMTISESEAKTEAQVNPGRIEYKQNNITPIVNNLNGAFKMLMELEPRKKLYGISYLFDGNQKDARRLDKQFEAMRNFFMFQAGDADDRASLQEVSPKRSGLVIQLVRLANWLDELGLYEEADIVDSVL